VHTEVPRPLAGEWRRLATGTVDDRRSSATHRPEHTDSAAPGQRERGHPAGSWLFPCRNGL